MDGCCDAVPKHPSKLGNAPSTTSLLPNASLVLCFFSLVAGIVNVWFMLSSCLELREGPRLRSGNQFVSTEANAFRDDVPQAGREGGAVNIHE